MEREKYDPYYRDLPSVVVPVRTPFTRSGWNDADHLFIYVTNKSKRWSVLLDKTRIESLYDEARQYIPRGIFQFWLLEKRYRIHKPGGKDVMRRTQNRAPANPRDSSRGPDRQGGTGRTLVVLREPEPVFARQSDILSYHFDETEAVTAAESYTRRHRRRAVVGMLLWDEAWW